MSSEITGAEAMPTRRELRARNAQHFVTPVGEQAAVAAGAPIDKPVVDRLVETVVEPVVEPIVEPIVSEVPSAAALVAARRDAMPSTFSLELPPEPDWAIAAAEPALPSGAAITALSPASKPRLDGWRTIEALPPQLRPHPARTGTTAVWLMVFVPVVQAAAFTLIVLGDPVLRLLFAEPRVALAIDVTELVLGPLTLLLATTVLFPLVTLLLAFADRGALRVVRMPRLASPWWVLLHPLVYLAVRTARVTRYTGRGRAPLVAWLVVNIGLAAIVPAAALLLSLFV